MIPRANTLKKNLTIKDGPGQKGKKKQKELTKKKTLKKQKTTKAKKTTKKVDRDTNEYTDEESKEDIGFERGEVIEVIQ